MILTFSSAIEAADTERRIIAGVVVPFGEVGATSVGPVMFERGSIAINDTAKVKLLLQHQPNAILGRAQSLVTTQQNIYGTFKVSASTAGTDALLMASEQLYGGLSVGVEVQKSEPHPDGYLLVKAAKLMEVSLVEVPAFENAQIKRIAASEGEAVDVPNPTTNESEAIVENSPAAATPEVETAPVVEASRPITANTYNPLNSQTVRHGITSMGRYTEHRVKAALGNDTSALWIKAAEDPMVVRAAADSIGSTNPAFNPVIYMNEFISNNNFATPSIDACTRGVLPGEGMTFSIPKLSTAPVVATVAESGTPGETGMVTAYLTGTVTKSAGAQTVTIELLERSSNNPAFYDELTIQMERAMLAAQDKLMLAALIAGGTISTVSSAATSAGIISFISTQAPLVYTNTSLFARSYLANGAQWGAIMGFVDTTGRPIYSANYPMNSAGAVTPSSIQGNVLGLNLYVSPNFTATTVIDNSAMIIAPEAATFYSSPSAYFSVNVVSSMSVNMAIYSYNCALVKQATGVRLFDLT